MELYRKLLEQANLDFKNADHMVYVTFPVVNDPKLMITIAEKLYHSTIDAITAILNYDYLYKRIGSVPEKDEEKIRVFKEYAIKRYSLDREILVLLAELKSLVEFRKKSPIEFIRKQNFVIANSKFSTKTIDIRKMKYYINDIKQFMEKTNKILKHGL